jgi:type VI secretion system protein ImpE
MDQAKDLFLSGRISDAIRLLASDLQSRPTDAEARTMLFECLCFNGDYERAAAQLDIIGHQNTRAEFGVQVFRQLIAAEAGRRATLERGDAPLFLMEPPAYITPYLQALGLLHNGQPAEARRLLEGAIENRPPIAGSQNGKGFAGFSDGDDLLAPVLEAAVLDRYAWIPFDQIRHMEFERPKSIRDMLWLGMKLELTNGQAVGLTTYPLYSHTSDSTDGQVRMGRATDWIDAGSGLMRGAGLRTYYLGDEEVPLLELQSIDFAAPASPPLGS